MPPRKVTTRSNSLLRQDTWPHALQVVALRATPPQTYPWELRRASAFNLRPLPCSTERVVSPAQDTPNESKLAPQPDEGYDSKCNATTEGGGSKVLGAKIY